MSLGSPRAPRRRAAALLTGTTLGLIAPLAVPGSMTPTAEAADTDVVAPTCDVRVVGVADDSGRVRSVDVQNGLVEQVRESDRRIPFTVTSLGFLGYETFRGGYDTFHGVTTEDGRPATLTLTYRRGEPTTTRSIRRFSTSNGPFYADLFTATPTPVVYAKRGRKVRQWRTYHLPGRPRQLIYDDARRVRARTGDLVTMSFADRVRIKRTKTDVLLATTRSGALVQLRVPVRRPGTAERRVLATSGFAGVQEISVGYCDNGELMLVTMTEATEGSGPVVQWHTLGRTKRMRPATVVRQGEVTGDVDWRMHAVS